MITLGIYLIIKHIKFKFNSHIVLCLQPGSAISVTGSHSSASSRRGKTRNYRVVSNTSQIDENLFGKPSHVEKRQELLEQKWANDDISIEQLARERSAKRNSKNGKKKNSKETVQVITKDLIRNLM